jgi:hypothetical protein
MEKKQLLKLYLAQDWRKIPKVQGLTYFPGAGIYLLPRLCQKLLRNTLTIDGTRKTKNYTLLLMTYEFVQLKNMHRNCNPPS